MKKKLCLLVCSALIFGLSSCEGFFETSPNGAKTEEKDQKEGEKDTNKETEDEEEEKPKQDPDNPIIPEDDKEEGDPSDPIDPIEDEDPNTPSDPIEGDDDDPQEHTQSGCTFDFANSNLTENAHLSDTKPNGTLVNELNELASDETFVTSISAYKVDCALKPLTNETIKCLKFGSQSESGSITFTFGKDISYFAVTVQTYFNRWSYTGGGGVSVDAESTFYVNDTSKILPRVDSTELEDETEIVTVEASFETPVREITIRNEGGRAYLNTISFVF